MTELLVVVFVVLLVYGGTSIPALGDAIGRAIRNVRRASAGEAPGGEDRRPPPAPPAR
jgi:sec-independent protein translocase protein TatA